MKKTLLLAAVLVFIAVAIAVLLKVNSQASREFTLLVENSSELDVDQLRLFGGAVEHEVVLLKLPPGQKQSLSVSILPSGTLKFEVSQGMNRIDSHIVEDTRILDDLEQRLSIQPGNRIMLSRD